MIIVGVVLSILEMIAVHDFGLALVGLDLPIVEIDLFKKFLLVEF
jgi:hypothetical protein